jgi:hypothetical protein
MEIVMSEVEFLEQLNDPFWRLNNLYYIKDKNGVIRKLKLNQAQREVVLKYKHNKKIILKSRQRGISTLYVAIELDDCIFQPGTDAGIQSYGKDETGKLASKAQLMWDKFDPDIKELLGIDIVANNSNGMKFNNRSELKIGNFRGDTLQRLHVSELAKIAKKFPEKARELKTGAFQAVGKNSNITVESTAEGNKGMFAEMWYKAVRHVGELGPFDFQPIFLSWVDDEDCYIDIQKTIDAEHEKYFSWIEDTLNITLQEEQKWWYISKHEELGDDMKQEYPTTPEEAFEQSVEGTILRNEFELLYKHERVGPQFTYVPGHKVYASYDLGVNDRTVVHFAQIINGRPRIFYSYSNSGQRIAHYVEIMQKLPFTIDTVFLPHDANVQELISGRTRIEEFQRLGVYCELLTRVSVEDGINAVRGFLQICDINSEECDDLLGSIQTYRWKHDKRLDVFLSTPEHDDSSNDIDSLKYMALGLTADETPGERMDEPAEEHYYSNSDGDFAI